MRRVKKTHCNLVCLCRAQNGWQNQAGIAKYVVRAPEFVVRNFVRRSPTSLRILRYLHASFASRTSPSDNRQGLHVHTKRGTKHAAGDVHVDWERQLQDNFCEDNTELRNALVLHVEILIFLVH